MDTNGQVSARRCLSVSETMNALGLCRSSVHKMIANGELASVKIGSRRLIPTTEIDRLIARKLEAGTKTAA